MSTRTAERAVGTCFLLVFVLYASGTAMVESGSGSPADLVQVGNHTTLISVGALLMLANSLVAAAIGVLLSQCCGSSPSGPPSAT